MNRRALLGLLAGGIAPVAGCVGTSRRDGSDGTTQLEDAPRVAVDADETPPEDGVNWEVRVEEQFSASAPARIEIRFANEAENPRTFETGAVAPFSEVRGSGPTSLLLVPDLDGLSMIDENDDGEFVLVPDPPAEHCWQAEDRPVIPGVVERQTVGPGGTLRETYEVVAAPNASGCLQSGGYRFSQTIQEVTEDGETEALSRWGFTLTISRP